MLATVGPGASADSTWKEAKPVFPQETLRTGQQRARGT